MATSKANLEEMEIYARLASEDEEEGKTLVDEEEVVKIKKSFILVGRFFTDKNIIF